MGVSGLLLPSLTASRSIALGPRTRYAAIGKRVWRMLALIPSLHMARPCRLWPRVPEKHREDLDRKDVLRYIARLKEKGNAPRTIHKRITFLRTFFQAHNAALPISRGDWPSYTERVVACYRSDELSALPAAADQDEPDSDGAHSSWRSGWDDADTELLEEARHRCWLERGQGR